MKLLFNILTISSLVTCTLFSAFLKKEEFTKSVNKEYSIEADGEVMLSNKYGKIDVRTTASDKVTIDVQIVVHARNESSAEDIFERINIDFESRNDFVSAKTIIENNSSWWGGGSKNYDMKINYSVNIPNTVELDVANKYGDVYITDLKNDLALDVDYGKFRVGTVHDVELDSKYSSGEIDQCDNLNADLAYVSGGLEIDRCTNGVIDSKYSKIRIKSAETIKSDAGYDTYEISNSGSFEIDGNYNKVIIGNVGNVVADSRYTNIEIDELTTSLEADLGYGGLDVYRVHSGFSMIDVDSDYGSVKIGVGSVENYSLDLSADYAGINVNDSELNVSLREKDGASNRLKASKGNGGGKIIVDSDYGGITIR